MTPPPNPRAAEAMASEKLRMAYINSLPQPFSVRFGRDGYAWPVESIEVQCALIRFDVCGKLEVKSFAEASEIIDADGVKHDPETFWSDYVPATSAEVLSRLSNPKMLTVVDTAEYAVERLANEHEAQASGYESNEGQFYAEAKFHRDTADMLRVLMDERDGAQMERDNLERQNAAMVVLGNEARAERDAALKRAPAAVNDMNVAIANLPADAFWRVGHDGEGPDPSMFKADVMVEGKRHSVTATHPAVALAVAGRRFPLRAPAATEGG